MRATWYVLEDGSVVDPAECVTDENGRLAHKSGARVAMRLPDCPMSRGVDLDASGKLLSGDQAAAAVEQKSSSRKSRKSRDGLL